MRWLLLPALVVAGAACTPASTAPCPTPAPIGPVASATPAIAGVPERRPVEPRPIVPRDAADRAITAENCSWAPCRTDELCVEDGFEVSAKATHGWAGVRCYAVPEACRDRPTCACVRDHLPMKWPETKLRGPGTLNPICGDGTTDGWYGPIVFEVVYAGDL